MDAERAQDLAKASLLRSPNQGSGSRSSRGDQACPDHRLGERFGRRCGQLRPDDSSIPCHFGHGTHTQFRDQGRPLEPMGKDRSSVSEEAQRHHHRRPNGTSARGRSMVTSQHPWDARFVRLPNSLPPRAGIRHRHLSRQHRHGSEAAYSRPSALQWSKLQLSIDCERRHVSIAKRPWLWPRW